MEPQVFPVFSALKCNIRKSITVSSRSPGYSTAIESLISALTARVLQRFTPMPTRMEVLTAVMWKIFNYCPMNNNILGGGGFSRDRPGRTNYSATGISLR